MTEPVLAFPVAPMVPADSLKAAQDERFRVLFEYSSDAHLVFDESGIIDCNNAAVSLLGCRSKSEVLGLHPAKLSPTLQPDGRRSDEKCLEMDELARRSGFHRFEWLHQKVSGESFPVEVTLTPITLAGRPAMLVVWHDLTERKRMEERLRQSVERFDLIAHGASMGMWETKLLGGKLCLASEHPAYWSPSFARLLGFDANEFAANIGAWFSRLHPDDVAATVEILEASVRSNRPYVAHYRLLTKDGLYRWFHATGAVALNTQGEVERLAGSIVDVTAQRDAESARRADAERFRQLSALAPVGIYLTDAAGRSLYVNDEWCRISGQTAAESLGDGWANAIHPEDRPAVCADWREAARTGTAFFREIRWLHKDGQIRWTSSRAVALHNEAGVCTGFVGSNEDITERKRAQAEIERLKANLDDALASIESGLVMFDKDERLVICNQAYRDLYELPEELTQTGISFEEMKRACYAATPERFAAMVGDAPPEEWLNQRMADCRTLNGGTIARVGEKWVRVEERRTKLGGIVGTRTDVTALVQKEEALQSAVRTAEQASKAKAEFLATMSHEIRTPMNGVIGMANLLAKTDLSPQQREFAETIRSCGEGLLTLINDILDYSKLEAGKLELESQDLDFSRLMDDVFPLFNDQAERKGVRLVFEKRCAVPTLVGDPTRLRQILLNLLSNAVKFTHTGRVQLTVLCEPLNTQQRKLRFTITDTGIGMTPAQLERLGLAFAQADASTTRRYGGSGLGLSICRSLVKMMNGELTVTSIAGEGTTVDVMVPLGVKQTVAVDTQELAAFKDQESQLRIARVLVAEDNVVNQRLITLMLRKHAQAVVVAADGLQALERFKQQQFDCVLMDCQMPQLDGYEATRRIRAWESEQQRKPTPIIALTANALPGDREECLQAGMNDYLSKPLRMEDLLTVLTRAVS
ncbi:MAG: PAS domain S-box protein [Deltaproteobacteria bacterium]|nr:PAS domain S-box protein [Deltaproteobacteria bacterium]